MSMLKKFWKDEAGLESLEYVVIAAVVLLALILGYKALVTTANTKLGQINSNM